MCICVATTLPSSGCYTKIVCGWCLAVKPVAYAVSADIDILWQVYLQKGVKWSQETASGVGQCWPAAPYQVAALPGGFPLHDCRSNASDWFCDLCSGIW